MLHNFQPRFLWPDALEIYNQTGIGEPPWKCGVDTFHPTLCGQTTTRNRRDGEDTKYYIHMKSIVQPGAVVPDAPKSEPQPAEQRSGVAASCSSTKLRGSHFLDVRWCERGRTEGKKTIFDEKKACVMCKGQCKRVPKSRNCFGKHSLWRVSVCKKFELDCAPTKLYPSALVLLHPGNFALLGCCFCRSVWDWGNPQCAGLEGDCCPTPGGDGSTEGLVVSRGFLSTIMFCEMFSIADFPEPAGHSFPSQFFWFTLWFVAPSYLLHRLFAQWVIGQHVVALGIKG